jgi:ABC-type Co2+ transport system permease subunit
MERLMTRGQVGACASRIAIGLLSVLIARFASDRWLTWSGNVYFLMGVTETLHGTMIGRRARKLAAQLTQSSGPPSGTAHPPPG